MKKFFIMMLLAGPLVIAGPPLVTYIGTTNMPIVPRRPISSATLWTNATPVSAGEYYENSRGEVYMALTAGTTTNEPLNTAGDFTADAVSWRKTYPHERRSLWLVNLSTNTLYLGLGYPAEAGKGIALIQYGSFNLDASEYDGQVNGIYQHGITNPVGHIEQ